MGVGGGGFCCSVPPYGRGQGESGGTHTGQHTGTYMRMLHLPFSDLPLKKCPMKMTQIVHKTERLAPNTWAMPAWQSPWLYLDFLDFLSKVSINAHKGPEYLQQMSENCLMVA